MALAKLSRAQKARSAVRALITEPNRKPVTLVGRELVAFARRDRGIPGAWAYFMNMLYKRDAGPADGYLSNRALGLIERRLAEPYDPDLDDKLRFYARARRAELPTPRLLATIHPDRVEIDGETRPTSDADTIAAALNDARAIAARGSIFVKPSDGRSGQDCFRIDADAGPRTVADVARRLRGRVFLVQETLVQHPDIARISPDALGCLRVHTHRQNGESRVLSMLMRFAPGTEMIDTPSQGAMFAPVDERTGRVLAPARTHFQLGAREYERHPVTDAPLGVTLPDWPHVLDLVHRASGAFEKPFVGWDVAFTVDGPILLEGNNKPHLLLAQIAARGLRSHSKLWPVLEPVLRQT